MPEATMQLGDVDCLHAVGNQSCEECWPNYPKPCDNVVWAQAYSVEYVDPQWVAGVRCPGLIHASFGDEMEDGYWLYTRCDVCGEAE
jgi:hypothetical protein